MNGADAEDQLFAGAIACEDVFPAHFITGAEAHDLALRGETRAEWLLRGVAAIEETPSEGSDDEARTPALQRIDARIDLLLDMMGELLRLQRQPEPLRAVRWSRNGVRIDGLSALEPGVQGVIRLEPIAWLPRTLDLPGHVMACEAHDGAMRHWLAFDLASSNLQAALERHLFRRHRRRIAAERRRA